MGDLPDFYSQAVVEAVEASSFTGGLEAALPASPVSRDIYLATDKKKLYICITDGTWTGFDASILMQGILTLYANMVGGSFKITDIADPTADQEAATKKYVDDHIVAGIQNVIVGYNTRVASGEQEITGLGFKPKIVLFAASVIGGTYQVFSIGFDDGTNHMSIDFFGTTVNVTPDQNFSVYVYRDADHYIYGRVTSLDADGFTMTWTQVGGSGCSFIYLAMR